MRPALAPLLATVRARRAARRIAELSDEIDQVLSTSPRGDAELLELELETIERMIAREITRAQRTLHHLDASEAPLAHALQRTIDAFEQCARGGDARLTAREWSRCVDELRAALLTASPVLRSAIERSAFSSTVSP